jgi:MFS family permease
MDSNIARRTIGVVAGVVSALLIVGVVQAIGHRLFPLPARLDTNNIDDVRQMIGLMSGSALSFVLLAYFLGSFIGGWVGLRIAQWRVAPWIVSLVILAGAIWSLVMIPHPLWVMVGCLVLPPLATILLLRRSTTGLA